MKKRIIILMLCGCVSMPMLTACGESSSDGNVVTEQASETEDSDDSTLSNEVTAEDSAEDTDSSDQTDGAAAEAASEAQALAAETEESMEKASEEMCSDADFEAIQTAYTAVCQQFELINQYCATIDLDDESKENLEYIKEQVDQYNGLKQSDMTTDDAVAIAQELAELATILNELATDLAG